MGPSTATQTGATPRYKPCTTSPRMSHDSFSVTESSYELRLRHVKVALCSHYSTALEKRGPAILSHVSQNPSNFSMCPLRALMSKACVKGSIQMRCVTNPFTRPLIEKMARPLCNHYPPPPTATKKSRPALSFQGGGYVTSGLIQVAVHSPSDLPSGSPFRTEKRPRPQSLTHRPNYYQGQFSALMGV